MHDEKDPIGRAISEYYFLHDNTPIVVQSMLIEDEEMPPDYFFRDLNEMPLLEKTALKQCKGSVLDIGAGAGCHTLVLQERGLEVCALELSESCCRVMKARGVKRVINKDIFQYSEEKYDTLLLLMNGIGIAGSPEGLLELLLHLKTLMKPGGKILLDSSDLIYLYEQPDGSILFDLNSDAYYGVVDYCLQYKKITGEPFSWLFADQTLLADTAELAGLKAHILEYGPHYDYLAEIIVAQ